MKQNFTTKNRKNSDLIHCGRVAPFLLWGFPSDLEFLTLKVNMMRSRKEFNKPLLEERIIFWWHRILSRLGLLKTKSWAEIREEME